MKRVIAIIVGATVALVGVVVGFLLCIIAIVSAIVCFIINIINDAIFGVLGAAKAGVISLTRYLKEYVE